MKILILPALLIALTLRLYPALSSGLPFSTDSWPLIRNTELLLNNTPIDLGSCVFDGYNNYWPASSLFGAVFSIITAIKPLEAMALSIPLTGGLAVLVFYVLVYRLSGDYGITLASSILFATAYPHTLFTAGITKETYANPLYILLILIFMIGNHKGIILFTITSIALALTHHLTPLITLTILFSLALGFLTARIHGLSILKPILVLVVVEILYFKIYAYRGFKVDLSWSEWISVLAYQVVSLSLASYLTLHPPSRRSLPIGFTIAPLLLALILLCMRKPIVPGAPILPSYYISYMNYSIVTALLAVLGYRRLREVDYKLFITALYWISAILGLEGYALFSGSGIGLALLYRGINFLWPPLTIFTASSLHKHSSKTPRSKYVKAIVASAMLYIILLNIYNFYAATILEERYMGYQWLYRVEEFNTGLWLSNFGYGLTVLGDMKASYMLNSYFNLYVNVAEGYRYLYRDSVPNGILYVYKQMLRNGYVAGPYGLDLPNNWPIRIHKLCSIYSNGFVNLFVA